MSTFSRRTSRRKCGKPSLTCLVRSVRVLVCVCEFVCFVCCCSFRLVCVREICNVCIVRLLSLAATMPLAAIIAGEVPFYLPPPPLLLASELTQLSSSVCTAVCRTTPTDARRRCANSAIRRSRYQTSRNVPDLTTVFVCVVFCRAVSRRVVSCRVASRRVVSCRIVSIMCTPCVCVCVLNRQGHLELAWGEMLDDDRDAAFAPGCVFHS